MLDAGRCESGLAVEELVWRSVPVGGLIRSSMGEAALVARLSSRWQDLRLLYGDTRSMCRFSLLVVNDDSRAEDTPQAIDRLQAVAGNGHICVTSVLETDELLLLVTRRLMMGGIFWQRKACRKTK